MKFRDKENNHAGRIEGCVVSKDSQTIVSPLRGFRAPSFDPATIVTPLRGWGLPAFHPTKRNDRVILPVPPYAGSRISGLESHTLETYLRVTKQVGSW